MKNALVATFAAAVFTLAGCAAPTDAQEPAPERESVASTSQALIVASNCTDYGNYNYECRARDGIHDNEGNYNEYVLLDYLFAWGDDLVEVENVGDATVTILTHQGFANGNAFVLAPHARGLVHRIDTLDPFYGVVVRVDPGDSDTVALRLHAVVQ